MAALVEQPEGVENPWFSKLAVLEEFKDMHGGFRTVFYDDFHALIQEPNDEAYVREMADYLRRIQSEVMFVRVERPVGSRQFVLGSMKCERVFSFEPRYEKMLLRF